MFLIKHQNFDQIRIVCQNFYFGPKFRFFAKFSFLIQKFDYFEYFDFRRYFYPNFDFGLKFFLPKKNSFCFTPPVYKDTL